MSTALSQELVRGHQTDRRADAEHWGQARAARAASRTPRTPRTPGRTRTGVAAALHALARRLEAGGPAVP
jgi:hypothetical protein